MNDNFSSAAKASSLSNPATSTCGNIPANVESVLTLASVGTRAKSDRLRGKACDTAEICEKYCKSCVKGFAVAPLYMI